MIERLLLWLPGACWSSWVWFWGPHLAIAVPVLGLALGILTCVAVATTDHPTYPRRYGDWHY